MQDYGLDCLSQRVIVSILSCNENSGGKLIRRRAGGGDRIDEIMASDDRKSMEPFIGGLDVTNGECMALARRLAERGL